LKNILITGACGGVGKELTLHFAQNGWNVIATMLCLSHAAVFKDKKNIYCYVLDVSCTTSIANAKKQILSNFPAIDVVVNNAGVGYRSFVELSDDEEINAIIDINYLGVVKVCRAFIPVFRDQNRGQFINISSIAGLVNLPLGSFYHSTKHAVESFSECMAYELAAFNISVATVQFGNTPSNFQKNIAKSDRSAIGGYNELMTKISGIVESKTKKNKDLKATISKQIFAIAEHPNRNFKRHTIGFDANLLRFLSAILGYRLFGRIIRRAVFK
jgi:NAD(P)-dependent dehydrogenase (short-subunit alcohol dehydrogenase family)